MTKIAFIGAGSFVFTRNLIRDMLTFPSLEDATFVLMDIHKGRLGKIETMIKSIIERGNYPAKVETTMDRKKALKGADAVICTVLAGGVKVWRHDIEIPKKYGVDFCVGDTRGVAAIFRALRTVPLMIDICRDIEKCCPDAVLLNYTNPMAMLCRAMQKTTDVQVTGLCHSVQGTAAKLAGWIGADMEDIDYVCAGINHTAFYLEYKWKGKDAYPLIHKAMKKKKVYNEEIVRNEMFLHLGYYVTESSGHNSEYNPWFRKREDLIKKYCLPGTGWNPGEYAYILKDYMYNEKHWQKKMNQMIKDQDQFPLERGHEYAAYILNAWMGGDAFKFNGNVPNTKLITNLPDDVCVEVPVVVNRRRFNSIHVGELPIQLQALIQNSVVQEEMAVEAALTGDPTLVFQAALFDPLCQAKLSMQETKDLVKEMLQKNKRYLPQFSSYTP